MKYLIFLFTFLYVFEGFSLDLEEAIKKYTGRGTQLAGEAGNICAIQSPQTSDATELAKYYCNDKGLMHYEVDPFFIQYRLVIVVEIFILVLVKTLQMEVIQVL